MALVARSIGAGSGTEIGPVNIPDFNAFALALARKRILRH
jgi:hypothetical protein